LNLSIINSQFSINCNKDESGNECSFTTLVNSFETDDKINKLMENKTKSDKFMKETCKSKSYTNYFLRVADSFNRMGDSYRASEFAKFLNSGVTYFNGDEYKAQNNGTPATTPWTRGDAPSTNSKSQATDGDSKTSGTTTIKASIAILVSIDLFL